MYTYSAFGLGVHSDLALPELLTEVGAKPDITIRLGKIDSFPRETILHDGIFRYSIALREAFFLWENIASFRVRNGKDIVIETVPGADESMIRILLLGAVFAVLLHQRRFLVLHGSAISVEGDAVAFIGIKGRGKSTLAASLYARGHEFIADDIVALQMDDPLTPMVVPAFPQIKLWPDSVLSSLGQDPETQPRVARNFDKRACRTSDRFTRFSQPLKRIYVISEGPSIDIELLQPREAILPLIANSHIARFGNQGLKGTEAAFHLRHCTVLANEVPIYCLTRPGALSLLPDVARLVEAHSMGDTYAAEIVEELLLVPSS